MGICNILNMFNTVTIHTKNEIHNNSHGIKYRQTKTEHDDHEDLLHCCCIRHLFQRGAQRE